MSRKTYPRAQVEAIGGTTGFVRTGLFGLVVPDVYDIELISDMADPRLQPFRHMRQQEDYLGRGIFVAEEPKIVGRLLASPHEVISVVVPPEWREEIEPLIAGRAEKITLFVVELKVLETLTGYKMHQGVLALARIPPPISESALLTRSSPDKPRASRLLIATDGTSNAENVGGLIRNAVALGADTLVSGENSAHPYLRRAVRASMGNIFTFPYFRCSDLIQTLQQLQAHGIVCVATTPEATATPLWESDLARDICLVFGAEGPGLRPEVIAACEESLCIPMHAGINSLNVGSAAAVIMAESARQRTPRLDRGQRVR